MYFFLCIAFAIIVPYLICSINPAIIAAKIKHNKDIREMGSGNPGLTNALRTLGKRAAGIVLLLDVLKSVISLLAVWGVWWSLYKPLCWEGCINAGGYICNLIPHIPEYPKELFLWVAALAAVLGHCYPLYYKFKGGKAVLVSVATLLVIDWVSALILLSLFIIIAAITKYVSLGSIIAALLFPVCVFIVGSYVGYGHFVWSVVPPYIMLFPTAMATLLIFKHRGNIHRLINGTEKKLGKKEEIPQ